MYKKTFDLQDMTAELDPEDRELMAMFPRNRAWAINDMVLVQQGDGQFLERKEVIAIRHKQAMVTLQVILTISAVTFLVGEIQAVVLSNGSPWPWFFGFAASVLPALTKFRPKQTHIERRRYHV